MGILFGNIKGIKIPTSHVKRIWDPVKHISFGENSKRLVAVKYFIGKTHQCISRS